MGTIWIREFTGGLDTRRMPETTPGGVLIQAQDGHITRGGEFEKRAAFVNTYQLPAGSRGLAFDKRGLYVFGSEPTLDVPFGVFYQQLAHPDGKALVSVPAFDRFAGKIYAIGVYEDGSIFHFYDGQRVTDWYDGRGRASFSVTGGDGTSSLTDIKVNGVSIIAAPVAWTTDNATTAAQIAAAINSHISSPDYEATSVDDRVNIITADVGASSNGYAVAFTLATGFAVTPSTGLVIDGGSDGDTTFEPGLAVRTFGAKMYALSGSNLHFSGIQQPTKWNTDAVGAGFIDMSSQSSGSEELMAVAPYQGQLAVFARDGVQIEYVDPNPANNKQVQSLNNTGTVSGRSVTQFGDSDLFYLSQSGLRSLRARDASNAASTTDIGVPVDTLIVEKIQSLSDAERAQIIGLIEPQDGRFWLIIRDTIFVFSFFNGAKVSAWTTYKPGFIVDYALVFNRRVYLRSGDVIYAYGGTGNAPVYDNTVAIAGMPFLDGDKPTQKKHWKAIDAAVKGEWDIFFRTEPTDITITELIATITETTFNALKDPAQGESTHISPLFMSKGDGYCLLASFVMHHDLDDAED